MSTTSYAELNALLERAGRPSGTPVPISADQLLGLQRRWVTALGARLDQAIERAGAGPTPDAVASAWRQLVADQPILRGILDTAESHSPSLAEATRGESRMLALAAGVAGLDDPFDQAARGGRAYRDMIHGDRPQQVELPVTALRGSIAWYRRLLDLWLMFEIVEDGVLLGAGLFDERARYDIALRVRSAGASTPDPREFDVVALRTTDHDTLAEVVRRCERLGLGHGGIRRTAIGEYLDVPDPDGTVLRFHQHTGPAEGFTGVELLGGVVAGSYDEARSA